ncbi:MAG: leucine-rich repeat domain-containing protein, partial [Waddliaceae bacterium]
MNPTTNNQRVINNPINPDNVPNNPDNRENAQIASVLGKWVRDESNAGSEPKKLKATASLSSSAQNEKSNSAENRAHLASQSILGKRKSSEDSSETHSLKLPYSPYNSRTQTRTFLNDVLQDFMSEIGDETEIKSIDEVDLEFLSKRRDLAEASGEVAIKYFKLLTKWNYTQFALNRFIDAIEDSSKLGLDEVNSDFLNQRRELAIKKGTVVVNDFNYVAKYLNKKDPEHPVKYIGNRSVINAKNSLNKAISLTPELQKLVLSALGTEEFKPKSVDEAIQIADQIHSHHLDLSDFREITDEQFKGIAKIHYLESINLSRLEFNQSGLAHLKSLQNLQALNLGHCRITDAGLAHLKDLPNLQALDLSFCYRITDAGLAQIKDLPNLQTLNLDHCRITDAGLAHLKYLPNLQTLYLNYCRQITDAGLAHLKDLPNLQTL